MIPTISIVGKTKSGKTTLLEKIIRELRKRGYKVGSIKHDVHSFEIDYPGKDSWKMTQAGADTMVIASSRKIAMVKQLEEEKSLDEISKWLFSEVDIIVTEGYKSENKIKIEINRKELGNELLCREDELLAVVSDQKFDLPVPTFSLEEIPRLIDFIEVKIIKEKRCL